jgi:hypothetical protein
MLQGSGDPAQVDLAKRLKAGLEGREMVSIIVDDTSSVYDPAAHVSHPSHLALTTTDCKSDPKVACRGTHSASAASRQALDVGRWSEHPENLFLVEPYVFFPGQRVTSRSLLEAERCANHAQAAAVIGGAIPRVWSSVTSITGAMYPPSSKEQRQMASAQSVQGRGGGARHAEHRAGCAAAGARPGVRGAVHAAHSGPQRQARLRKVGRAAHPPAGALRGQRVPCSTRFLQALFIETATGRLCCSEDSAMVVPNRRLQGAMQRQEPIGVLEPYSRPAAAARPGMVCCGAFSKQASVETLVQVQVLRGVVIMFSRIIPLDEVPSQHALWLRAEAFGARCTAQTDDAVTHLVTNTQHTLKVPFTYHFGTVHPCMAPVQ